MNEKLVRYIQNTKHCLKSHSPEIFTGLGITCMIGSTVLAVKETPKALELIRRRKEELKIDKLTIKETIKTTWKLYIPTAVSMVCATSLLVASCSINNKRKAALVTAYSLSDRAFRTYRDEVIRTFGEKKEKQLRDNINQEKVDENKVNEKQIIITPKGNTLCKDSLSGRYFRSDMDVITKIVNEVNRRLITENYISLNEFYDNIGLSHVKDGDNLGWSIEAGFLEVDYSACITDSGEPCIVVDYNIAPFTGYNKF